MTRLNECLRSTKYSVSLFDNASKIISYLFIFLSLYWLINLIWVKIFVKLEMYINFTASQINILSYNVYMRPYLVNGPGGDCKSERL